MHRKAAASDGAWWELSHQGAVKADRNGDASLTRSANNAIGTFLHHAPPPGPPTGPEESPSEKLLFQASNHRFERNIGNPITRSRAASFIALILALLAQTRLKRLDDEDATESAHENFLTTAPQGMCWQRRRPRTMR